MHAGDKVSDRKLRAVLFDLGGTLVRTGDPAETHRRILETHGLKFPYAEVAQAHKKNKEEHDAREMAKRPREYWIKWNLRLLKQLGVQGNKAFLAKRIDEVWNDYFHVELYQDVMETLDRLKDKQIKLGIVTNGLEREVQEILDKFGLTGYFDAIVGVDVCGKAKPDTAIFLYAVEKLNVRPEEAIFIGDSFQYDYEGARRAGLKPLLLSREGTPPAKAQTINSLSETLKFF